MKKYTKNDLKSFEVVNGHLICPTGDYTEIKSFDMKCRFGEQCSFEYCCSFGEQCRFGEQCSFGQYCSFGKSCRFGESCSFEEYCSFGEMCRFGESCSFGEMCSFGEQCRFGQECIIENNVHLLKFLKFEGFGREKRCTYFFLDTDKNIFVRCGCFFGNLEKFKEEVKKTHGDKKFGVGYLKVADLAEWQLLN